MLLAVQIVQQSNTCCDTCLQCTCHWLQHVSVSWRVRRNCLWTYRRRHVPPLVSFCPFLPPNRDKGCYRPNGTAVRAVIVSSCRLSWTWCQSKQPHTSTRMDKATVRRHTDIQQHCMSQMAAWTSSPRHPWWWASRRPETCRVRTYTIMIYT
jgi:hypothetical protein